VPGDGIGKDVLAEAVRVLESVQERLGGFQLEMTELPWGSDYYFAHGTMVPDDFLERLRRFDAIFLGALGDPARLPDAVSLAPLVQIRQQFDQYACMRPSVLWPGVRSPLTSPGTIDLVVVRENSEGEYVVCGGRARCAGSDQIAIQSAIHSRKGVERILRFGFELAQSRRRRLTMITKSNALVYSMVLWDEVLQAIRQDYPHIEADALHADAAAMELVRRPSRFDVVVASNLFGDILTDLASIVVGGLGLAPSANINPERKFPSMFEPVHGSAPDIVGKGVANPVAAILSGAMMLQWLGLENAAASIRTAVKVTLANGETTPDLGGELTTHEAADRIIGRILEEANAAKACARERSTA
jgi:tartrate dehydrogenase/decarboxylase/D-malate dehydrogenase